MMRSVSLLYTLSAAERYSKPSGDTKMQYITWGWSGSMCSSTDMAGLQNPPHMPISEFSVALATCCPHPPAQLHLDIPEDRL